jgi:SAM-dependent methyltransferase
MASEPSTLDPGNVAADAAWNGPDGDHWAANADAFDASLARYRQAFLDATRITADHRVLDIGCGNGTSSLDAARLARDGTVLGVDLSEAMLDVARQRANDRRVTNVTFLRTDAQVHPFEPARFDAAISHTGAMFFSDPVAAFTNIARALRSAAPLTLLAWQAYSDNDWIGELSRILGAGRPVPPPNAPGPFSLADPERTRTLLDASGYRSIGVDGHCQPMYFGATVDDALEFMSGLGVFRVMLDELDQPARASTREKLRANIETHHGPDGVCYPSAMWIVTATRN